MSTSPFRRRGHGDAGWRWTWRASGHGLPVATSWFLLLRGRSSGHPVGPKTAGDEDQRAWRPAGTVMSAPWRLLGALTALTLTTASCPASGACSHQGYTSCDAVQLPAAVTRLYLSGNNLHSVDAACFPARALLVAVDVSHNGVVELAATAFDEQPRLVSVDLSGNLLSELPAALFANAGNLTWLSLAGNELTAVPPLTAPSLRDLDLSDNRIAAIADASAFAAMRHLVVLDLTGNRLARVDAAAFAGLALATLRLCVGDAATSALGVVPGAVAVVCRPTSTPPGHLVVVGVATLVSCVCALVVVAIVFVAVQARKTTSGGVAADDIEFRVLPTPPRTRTPTPTHVTTSRTMPTPTPAPDNGGYERPAVGNEVDRLPMAPLPPPQYMEVLDTEAAVGALIAVGAPSKKLLREMSLRELPPLPVAVGLYEPVGEATDGVGVGVGVGGRNSFSEFALARASTGMGRATVLPPIPPRPAWKIAGGTVYRSS